MHKVLLKQVYAYIDFRIDIVIISLFSDFNIGKKRTKTMRVIES